MAKTESQTGYRTPDFQFATVDGFERMLGQKGKFDYEQVPLYFRDGYPHLAKLEEHIASLAGSDKEHTLLTTNGMSALITAVEITAPTAGDVLLHGEESYNQTYGYFQEDLRDRGVKSLAVDAGSVEAIERQVARQKPKLVVLETITNGPSMTVLDTKRLLNSAVIREVNPVIILDNTLPTNSHLPLAEMLKQAGVRAIGVESASKSYALNQELGGIVYTYDETLLAQLHRKRRRMGSTPNPSAVIAIEGVVPPTKEQFDIENKKIAQNTLALAHTFAAASADETKFMVAHPNLPSHPQTELANQEFPEGASPVFFVMPLSETFGPVQIARAFEDDGVLANSFLAQSFGFSKTGISFDERREYLRVAGGLESPEQLAQLQKRMYEALAKM